MPKLTKKAYEPTLIIQNLYFKKMNLLVLILIISIMSYCFVCLSFIAKLLSHNCSFYPRNIIKEGSEKMRYFWDGG